QMTLFALFALLDREDRYERRCREIVQSRLDALARGLGADFDADSLRVGYYVDLDLEAWGRKTFGDDFTAFIAEHHEPVDVVLDVARRYGLVLLNGSGFDGPPWSVRISMANLDAADYEAIGRDLKAMVRRAVDEWCEGRGRRG